jgi:hypothetical protein
MNFFDTFDSGSKRFLTPGELNRAYYRIYGENAWIGQAESIINGLKEKKVTRANFDDALEELDRRNCLEKSLYVS